MDGRENKQQKEQEKEELEEEQQENREEMEKERKQQATEEDVKQKKEEEQGIEIKDEPDKIKEILIHSNHNKLLRYFVLWESEEKTWVEEEDMNCPQLLVEFTKTVATKTKLPHELLETLIEALEGFTKEIQNPQCKLTNVGIKQKIKEFIG